MANPFAALQSGIIPSTATGVAPSSFDASVFWSPERSVLSGADEYQQLIVVASGPYRWALLANAAFVLATFPLLVFLIGWRTPPEMGLCIRVLIFNSIVICTLQAIWHAIMQHVPLYPLFVGFSLGAFRSWQTWMPPDFAAFLQLLGPTLLTLNSTFAFLNYYALLNPMWRYSRQFSKLNPMSIAVYILATLLNCVICMWFGDRMCLPPSIMRDDVQQLPASTFERIVLAREPSLIGLAYLSQLFWWAQGIFFAWIAGQAVLIVVLNIRIVMEMKKWQSTSLPSTSKVLAMAYWMFLTKSLLLLVFFFLPFLVINLTLADIIHNYFPSMISHAMISLNSSVIHLQIMFLVKPYRQWFCRHLHLPTKIASIGAAGGTGGAVNVNGGVNAERGIAAATNNKIANITTLQVQSQRSTSANAICMAAATERMLIRVKTNN